MTAKQKFKYREEWLNAATMRLNKMIGEKTDLTPAKKVLVSAGWPRRDRGGRVIGQCYPTKTSMGTNHVFISPTLSDPITVLHVLLHELVHAADDCKSQHKGPFTKAVRALGLAGKPTATVPSPDLIPVLKDLAKDLGPYPHSVLVAGDFGPARPQTTRMLKVVCQRKKCGCTIRMTRKWLDQTGAPTCACGGTMKEEKTDA